MFLGPGWRSSTVEQLICNQQVVGSSPIASSMQKNCLGGGIIIGRRLLVGSAGQGIARCLTRRGEVPEWPKGADCKSAGYAFEGSNPSLSTILFAGIAQLVEREPSKLGVAGSSPVSRSNLCMTVMAHSRGPAFFSKTQAALWAIDGYAQVAQSVEHVLGKDEVGGSIPLLGFCPDYSLLYAEDSGIQTNRTAIDWQTYSRRKR
jgi:hypothetical protein